MSECDLLQCDHFVTKFVQYIYFLSISPPQISVNFTWIQTLHTKTSNCQKRTEKHHVQIEFRNILITQNDLICFPTSCVERVCAVAVTGRLSAVGTSGL